MLNLNHAVASDPVVPRGQVWLRSAVAVGAAVAAQLLASIVYSVLRNGAVDGLGDVLGLGTVLGSHFLMIAASVTGIRKMPSHMSLVVVAFVVMVSNLVGAAGLYFSMYVIERAGFTIY